MTSGMRWRGAASLAITGALAGAAIAAGALASRRAAAAPPDAAARCLALRGDAAAGIDEAVFHPAAPAPAPPPGPMPSPYPAGLMLPAHCDLHGTLDRRDGADGQHYAIRYHLRLPEGWNSRFFFQGGGGTDGVVGDALGDVGRGRAPALTMGYAVVSQDSGHDNTRNNDPARGGDAVFGGDPEARANYGGTSLKRVADVAKAVVARFYGQRAERSYFFGCSKGGQEGMVLAQRYPDEFDGIVAGAPGFALPRAALAQTWDVQTFGALTAGAGGRPAFERLPAAFSDAQLAAVRTAILAACDADDGLTDGIVGRFAQCTAARVLPHLRALHGPGALSAAQIAALARSLGGPRDGAGQPLYSNWPWDGGIGAEGWRFWKLGSPRMPALNLLLGGPALAMIFTVPPTPVAAGPGGAIDYETRFDFARDAARIYATDARFPRSGWTDISAHSPDLDAFRAHGGKLIVPHGASDPVFSILDTLAWYRAVQARTHGQAADFARVFAVPGMNHCGGGPATDDYDAFGALVAWVEKGRAPERIEARAGPTSPWPGRTRPLCPFPEVATYTGHGSIENAANFTCR